MRTASPRPLTHGVLLVTLPHVSDRRTLSATPHAQVMRLEIRLASRRRRQAVGAAGPYEIMRGPCPRRSGSRRSAQQRSSRICELAPRNARGRVEYVATFALAKPIDPAKASGVLIYQVVNRGNGDAAASPDGDISLVSGWQGTSSRPRPTRRSRCRSRGTPTDRPSPARSSRASTTCRPARTPLPIRLSSMGSGPPVYPPADLDQPTATLTMSRVGESDRREERHA